MKGSDIMGKNYFTNEQVEFLRKNKYVKHVSNKGITYSLEFKELFIKEYGLKNPAKIFEDAGLPIPIAALFMIMQRCYNESMSGAVKG